MPFVVRPKHSDEHSHLMTLSLHVNVHMYPSKPRRIFAAHRVFEILQFDLGMTLSCFLLSVSNLVCRHM
jgi:hypothetical protein